MEIVLVILGSLDFIARNELVHVIVLEMAHVSTLVSANVTMDTRVTAAKLQSAYNAHTEPALLHELVFVLKDSRELDVISRFAPTTALHEELALTRVDVFAFQDGEVKIAQLLSAPKIATVRANAQHPEHALVNLDGRVPIARNLIVG